MNSRAYFGERVLEELLELLDIPTSYYERAADRYRSLGDWFHRKASVIAEFDPQVYPQGSFRYGTVNRPLGEHEEYDLDLVCRLALSKSQLTQEQLKHLVGIEVRSYADANRFHEPAEEKKRCWRLNYADEVSFHMDILPAVPDDHEFIQLLIASGVPAELAVYAIGITDIRHHNYSSIDQDWPRSNPKGFAKWFENRMQDVSLSRRQFLAEQKLYASVDDVPSYEWKTPLQRSIQLLKRHRDVMFAESPELKPISMIITTLAARAYSGETNLYEAITNILDRMPAYVRDDLPRVPNPVNPAEDFADRWAEDPRLERNFRAWHRQAKADFANIPNFDGTDLEDLIEKRFRLEYRSSKRATSARAAAAAVPAVHVHQPSTVNIVAPASPWRP